MATEILVNDGGAPSRILPFTANGAISGGEVVEIERRCRSQKLTVQQSSSYFSQKPKKEFFC